MHITNLLLCKKTTNSTTKSFQCCSICGLSDHNAAKCKKPADGMGNVMNTKEHNTYMDDGFLVIEIGYGIGSTIVPQSSEEYDVMRNNSIF